MIEEIIKGEARGASASITGRFDDTGFEAARCNVTGPVIAIGGATFSSEESRVAKSEGGVEPVVLTCAGVGRTRRCFGVRASHSRPPRTRRLSETRRFLGLDLSAHGAVRSRKLQAS